MDEHEGKLLSIEIRAGKGIHPELLDLLKEGIGGLTKDLLIPAGVGFELDSVYSPGDESVKERTKELEESGRIVEHYCPPSSTMDVEYLLRSTFEINVTVEDGSA